jgi:hypothetical protein
MTDERNDPDSSLAEMKAMLPVAPGPEEGQ